MCSQAFFGLLLDCTVALHPCPIHDDRHGTASWCLSLFKKIATSTEVQESSNCMKSISLLVFWRWQLCERKHGAYSGVVYVCNEHRLVTPFRTQSIDQHQILDSSTSSSESFCSHGLVPVFLALGSSSSSL